MSILGVVVCGAPLATRAHDVVAHARRAGWDVSLIPTEAASGWLEHEDAGTGPRPRPCMRRRPDALLVCPLTFNSASKWAVGIADNRPLSVMCEALGAGIPIIAVPMVNETLWQHPAWAGHLQVLSDHGVVLVDPATGEPVPASVKHGTGDLVAAKFDPQKILAMLAGLVDGPPS